MIQLIIAVLSVILISATCSLMEAVLYSVPISHIESLVQAEKPTGSVLQRLRAKVDEPIAAILSLNTISNTAGAAVAGAIAANVLGSTWVGLFSAVFTLAILFFAEVIPKTVGVVYSKPLSEWIARPLLWLVWLFKPLIRLLGFATRSIAGDREQEEQISESELLVMAQMGVKTGAIKEAEGVVIRNMLSLEDKIVREIMTPRTVMFALPGDITVEEANEDKRMFHYSRIPVYFDDDIENTSGIVYRQAIFTALIEDRLDTKISTLMKPVDFVFERANLDEVLKKFLNMRRHMFVVLGEFGDITGLVTLEDVLEEILGTEIVDESDQVEDMQHLAQLRRKELLKKTASGSK